MQGKAIAALIGLLIIAIIAYAFISLIASGGTEAPRGPVGQPYVKGPSGPPPSALLRECPDEWIDNQMPLVGESPESRQYFIMDGARRELSEFDVAWVRGNCNIQPQVVY